MSWQLIEYIYNAATKRYEASGNTFTFDPPPEGVTKSVKVEWRLRHRGLRNDLKYNKWRYRKTEEFKLTGRLESETARRQLEAFATRNAKFKFVTPNNIFASLGTESEYKGSSFTATDCYVVITGADFELEAGKTTYKYSLTFERVKPP